MPTSYTHDGQKVNIIDTPGHVDFVAALVPGLFSFTRPDGNEEFAALADEEPGTFYLTDFLTRHFDRLVRSGLGLNDHPELLDAYFANYRKLVYLAQTESPDLDQLARRHADYLGLEYQRTYTGLGNVDRSLRQHTVQWPG